MDYEATLQPGAEQSAVLGLSSDRCGYTVELSPLEEAKDGVMLDKWAIQPQFNGKAWNDVLKLTHPKGLAPLKVNVRVYRLSAEKGHASSGEEFQKKGL